MRLLSGRGVREGAATWQWRYRLEIDREKGSAKGELSVEGWEESRAMADWVEARRPGPVSLVLEGEALAVRLAILGARVHESGHYSETDIQVEGSVESCP